ncbi:complex I NDUFA9 subunit family protein [Pseudoruegeria sp. SK021]|uniref:complex I NDUFA9 subunit family protein n=1 Tax=Pseudoruegeria sp. SK021 TaxID=1933035 RepID=UPI000A2489B3|nr:complex I NDUFA9 subunit family protein [Pseudoruegeria sp. SK021]OSP54433.1 complex I NDUFA9 subunit family protein [Pseudoruegeria sp. SK021]
MSQLVTIFGGSGFVGRYVARRMAKEGWRVRVACRRPNEAQFVRTYGAVGQVEPVFCNIRDDASVRNVLGGANAVVNCVGILNETGKSTFEAIQAAGAGRVARLSAEAGITRFVQMSALGANADSASDYARTKAAGEAAVLEHQPTAMILRPSVIFGPEDQFFNRFAGMARFGPILPIVGADTLMQPVYVDDVAEAVVAGVLGQAPTGIYELGGPDVRSFRDLITQMLTVIRRRRLVLNVPFPIAGMMGWGFDLGQKMTGGLIENTMLTRDQVRNLQHDNVVTDGAQGFAQLGIEPVAIAAVVNDYLWRFRPSGQFDEVTESAKNLKV